MSTAIAEPQKAGPQNAISNWMAGNPSIKETPAAIAPAAAPDKPAEPAPAQPAKPAAPAQPAVAAPVDDEGDEKWPRSADDWKKFKGKSRERLSAVEKERDAIQQEKEALNKEIERLKSSGPSPELDAIKKERDELSERLSVLDVERHPRFVAHFNGRIEGQIELAKRAVGPNGAERIAQVLKLAESPYRDQQLEEIMSGLTTLQQGRLGSVLNNLEQIQQERQAEIAKAAARRDQMTAEQKTQAEQAREQVQQQWENAFAQVTKQAQDPKDGLYIFQTREGTDEATIAWNEGVKQRMEVAKGLLLGKDTTPERIAKASMYAAGFPEVLRYAIDRDGEVKRLQEQITKLTAASPGAGASEVRPNGEAPRAPEVKPGTNPFEASKMWAKGMQDAMRGTS